MDGRMDGHTNKPKAMCPSTFKRWGMTKNFGCISIVEGAVLLWREISLKVICEKVKFLNCEFCNNLRLYEWTYILIIQDVQTEANGKINLA